MGAPRPPRSSGNTGNTSNTRGFNHPGVDRDIEEGLGMLRRHLYSAAESLHGDALVEFWAMIREFLSVYEKDVQFSNTPRICSHQGCGQPAVDDSWCCDYHK